MGMTRNLWKVNVGIVLTLKRVQGDGFSSACSACVGVAVFRQGDVCVGVAV